MEIFDKRSDAEKEVDRYGMNIPLNQDNPNRVYVKPPKPFNVFTLIFFILFFLLMLSPFLLSKLFYSEDATNVFIPIIFLSLFSLLGVFIAVAPFISATIKKRRCKIPLKALVVDMKSRIRKLDKGLREYAPVYQYFYGGKEYIATEITYRAFPVTHIGDEIDVLINETNPEEYYINDKCANLTTLVVGLIFAVFPIILFFIIK